MSFLTPYNEEQFVALVRQRLPFFRGLALRILKNAEDTDEAVQTALLRGWSRRLFLRTPEKLSAWVSRIILNESYNILRRKKKEKAVAAGVAAEESAAGASAERERLLQRLEEAITRLPEPYRQTIQVMLLPDMDTAAAIARLGCSANTYYQRIHKAKQLLRKEMKDE